MDGELGIWGINVGEYQIIEIAKGTPEPPEQIGTKGKTSYKLQAP